jgi:hypothetical protein
MERRAFRIGDRQVNRIEFLERGTLAALSVLSVSLPIISISAAGAIDDVFLHDFQLIGGAAYLLSLAYAVGLFGAFSHAMRHHMRFIDLAGLIVTMVAISRAVYLIAWNAIPAGEGAAEAAAASDVHLSYGSLPLLFLLLGGIWRVCKSWRG